MATEPGPIEKLAGKKQDKEFDPTAEMMVNDFDDERTLDEEEAMEGSEDSQAELSNLQKEGDMPLEELLRLYGYAGGGEEEGESSSSEALQENEEEEEEEGAEPGAAGEGGEGDATPEEPNEEDEMGSEDGADLKPQYSELQQLYADELPSVAQGGAQARGSGEEEEEEEDDYDYSPDEDDEWKKTIMVGPDFQAAIPDGLCRYDDALPYENEDKLLWEPSPLSDTQAEDYLVKAQEPLASSQQPQPQQGVHAVPTGSHIKDDEQALYLLLQCGFNMDEALRRRRMNVVAPTDTMSLWSEEECRNFENGLRIYGKDFHLIQQNKVRTRSVGELVQFYYLWKKTERHDVFANKARLEKKKYTLHPGITDYMDRLLDDQESVGPSRDRSLSPITHCLIYGDPKRQQRVHDSFSESSSHTLLSSMAYSHGGAPMCSSKDKSLDNFLRSPDVRLSDSQCCVKGGGHMAGPAEGVVGSVELAMTPGMGAATGSSPTLLLKPANLHPAKESVVQ